MRSCRNQSGSSGACAFPSACRRKIHNPKFHETTHPRHTRRRLRDRRIRRAQPSRQSIHAPRPPARSRRNYPASNAIDGKITDDSRWVSETSESPHGSRSTSVESASSRASIFTPDSARRTSSRPSRSSSGATANGQAIPSAEVTRQQVAAPSPSPSTKPSAWTPTSCGSWMTASHQGVARVKEIVVWPQRSRRPARLAKAAAAVAVPKPTSHRSI